MLTLDAGSSFAWKKGAYGCERNGMAVDGLNAALRGEFSEQQIT
jgi:hypothetical protein